MALNYYNKFWFHSRGQSTIRIIKMYSLTVKYFPPTSVLVLAALSSRSFARLPLRRQASSHLRNATNQVMLHVYIHLSLSYNFNKTQRTPQVLNFSYLYENVKV